MLRSPGGLGVDLVSLIGFVNHLLANPNDPFGSAGANITNLLVDDDQVPSAANDMTQATDGQAPYTGTWVPVFNGPWPALFGTAVDPVGNLSRFDGLSTKGTWSVAAADQFTPDAGTLNTWSMLVTPVHFACTPFAAAAAVSATKTVAGTFDEAGNITYTVILTNNGTADQGDNAGNEFSDTLPAGLTLVSAIASSGAAGTAGNTATWNGSIPAFGGSVTITITATVNAGTGGTQQCNQGVTAYDGDDNGTNEAAGVTDDPGTMAAGDPTCFTVAGGSFVSVTATKTVSGSFQPGSVVTYTVVLTNNGTLPQTDNPGHEFTDTLPAGVSLINADDGGDPGTFSNAGNTVNWDGTIAANGGTVTITIHATITASTGQTISNQGQAFFDADGNGTNESSVSTDDPAEEGSADPTEFVVGAASVLEIPTLDGLGLALLGLALMGVAMLALRRRRTAA